MLFAPTVYWLQLVLSSERFFFGYMWICGFKVGKKVKYSICGEMSKLCSKFRVEAPEAVLCTPAGSAPKIHCQSELLQALPCQWITTVHCSVYSKWKKNRWQITIQALREEVCGHIQHSTNLIIRLKWWFISFHYLSVIHQCQFSVSGRAYFALFCTNLSCQLRLILSFSCACCLILRSSSQSWPDRHNSYWSVTFQWETALTKLHFSTPLWMVSQMFNFFFSNELFFVFTNQQEVTGEYSSFTSYFRCLRGLYLCRSKGASACGGYFSTPNMLQWHKCRPYFQNLKAKTAWSFMIQHILQLQLLQLI